jgi:hypothetical protein
MWVQWLTNTRKRSVKIVSKNCKKLLTITLRKRTVVSNFIMPPAFFILVLIF